METGGKLQHHIDTHEAKVNGVMNDLYGMDILLEQELVSSSSESSSYSSSESISKQNDD